MMAQLHLCVVLALCWHCTTASAVVASPLRAWCAVINAAGGTFLRLVETPADEDAVGYALQHLRSGTSDFERRHPELFGDIDEIHRPELLAYIDSMHLKVQFTRRGLRRHLRQWRRKILLSVESIGCAPSGRLSAASTRLRMEGDWLVPDFDSFNLGLEVDWDYLFGGGGEGEDSRRVDVLRLAPTAVVGLGEPGLRVVARMCERYLEPRRGYVEVPAGAAAAMRGVGLVELEDEPQTAGTGTAHVRRFRRSSAGRGGAHSCDVPGVLGAEAYVINLDRRPDRWRSFLATMQSAGVPPEAFVRHSGADGRSLDLARPDIVSIFGLKRWGMERRNNPHSNHGYLPGLIGNSMSHLAVWDRVASGGDGLADDNDFAMVFEDDLDHVPAGFAAAWRELSEVLRNDQTWDVVYLGVFSPELARFYPDREVHVDALARSPSAARAAAFAAVGGLGLLEIHPNVERGFGAGIFAYALRKRGARKLANSARQDGIMQACDWFMHERVIRSPNFVAYKCHPNLVTSYSVLDDPHRSPGGNGRDSDVGAQAADPNHRMLNTLRSLGEGDADEAARTRNRVSFRIASPENGTVTSPDFVIRGSVEDAAPELFAARHRSSRLCFRVRPAAAAAGGGDVQTVTAAAAAAAASQGDDGSVGCKMLTESGGLRASILGAGWHLLEVELLSMYDDVVARATSIVNVMPPVRIARHHDVEDNF